MIDLRKNIGTIIHVFSIRSMTLRIPSDDEMF